MSYLNYYNDAFWGTSVSLREDFILSDTWIAAMDVGGWNGLLDNGMWLYGGLLLTSDENFPLSDCIKISVNRYYDSDSGTNKVKVICSATFSGSNIGQVESTSVGAGTGLYNFKIERRRGDTLYITMAGGDSTLTLTANWWDLQRFNKIGLFGYAANMVYDDLVIKTPFGGPLPEKQLPGTTYTCPGRIWNKNTQTQENFDYSRYWNLQYGDITLEWTADFKDAVNGRGGGAIEGVPGYSVVGMFTLDDAANYYQSAPSSAGLTWGIQNPVQTAEFVLADSQADTPKNNYNFYGDFPGIYSSTDLTCTQGYSYSSTNIHKMSMKLHYNSNGNHSAYLWVDGNPQLDENGQPLGISFIGQADQLFLVKKWNNFGFTDKGTVIIGDIEVSQDVNLGYLAVFFENWLKDDCNLVNDWCAIFDRNKDGIVNFKDFADFSEHFQGN